MEKELIYYLFDLNIATQILNRTLFSQVTVDRLVWQGEKNSGYMVRIAYKICSVVIQYTYFV